MKITLLVNKDIASCIALNRLVPALVEHQLTIGLSAFVGNVENLHPGLQTLKFFEQDLFNELLFPLIDGCHPAPSVELKTFEALGHLAGTKIQEFNAINTGTDLEKFKESSPDLVISIRYGVILKDVVIEIPKYGVLNLHSGLLPAYKGIMATFRAMLNGDKQIGSTLHYIDDHSIDAGPIVGSTFFPVQKSRSYLWHVLQLYEAGCQKLIEAVNTLAAGNELNCVPQIQEGNYYSFPTEAELSDFVQKGLSLVESDETLSIARRFLTRY